MMTQFNRTWITLCLLLSACSPAPSEPVKVPSDWRATSAESGNTSDEEVAAQVDRILSADTEALEVVEAEHRTASAKSSWHMEYFMTDLSISTSGTLGALAGKGTPAVSVFWRKQYDAKDRDRARQAFETTLDVSISGNAGEAEIEAQLEPALGAMVRSGLVSDEPALRMNLARVIPSFVRISHALDRIPGTDATGDWWVSRFRMDLIVEASGKVTPLMTAGGEARLRFEWHRMMPNPFTAINAVRPEQASGTEIEAFVRELSEDVAAASRADDRIRDSGFEPYQFRVGVGYTEKGSIGVIKEQGTAIGHIYFSRNAKKPTVHPSPTPTPLAAKPPKVEEFSDERQIFRKGLERAFKIGGVFAKGARRASKPGAHWKIFELKTGFDVSLTGKLAIAEVGGLGTAEIGFYNENF